MMISTATAQMIRGTIAGTPGTRPEQVDRERRKQDDDDDDDQELNKPHLTPLRSGYASRAGRQARTARGR